MVCSGSFVVILKCELDSLHASEAWDEGLEWESYQFGRTSWSYCVFYKCWHRARAGVVLHHIIASSVYS